MFRLNIFQECEFFSILNYMETTHYINKLKEKKWHETSYYMWKN